MPSTPAASPFISPLPRPTSAKIRSSLNIPSIPDILREVVQNSLDAGSGRTDIWIDLTSGSEKLRVEDDGSGIRQEGMKKIGRRYGSSKARHLESLAPTGTYGFRGEALASISALCLLEIVSCARDTDETYTKIIKNSKILFDGVSQRPLPRSHGTTVTIKDIFQHIPVRRASLAAASTASVIAACKKVVETMALAYPAVKWGMWEEHGGVGTTRRILQLSGGKTAVDVFKAIYGSAGVEKVQTIRVSSGVRRIDGFISLEGALTQTHQHLYINRFPIERSEISRAISRRFSASKFSMMTDDGAVDFTPGRRKSPRRVERYPIYVIDIALPPEDIDLAYEPKKGAIGLKNEEALKAFVLAVVDEFLRRHSFVFPRIQQEEPETAATTAAPAVPLPHGPSRAVTPSPRADNGRATENQFWSAKSAFWRARDAMGSTPTGRANPMRELGYLRPDSPALGPAPPSSLGKRKVGWIDDIVSGVDGHTLPFIPRSLEPEEDASNDHPPALIESCAECARHHGSMPCSERTRAKARHVTSDVAIDPVRLTNAIILGQVDAKFIACVLPPSVTATIGEEGKAIVILVDQHAADERIAVEGVLQELCEGFLSDSVGVRYLEESPMIILTRQEATILAAPEMEDILRRWGVVLDTASLDLMDDSSLEYFQVPILGIPETLEFRLSRKEAHEVGNLVKLHLPFLAEHIAEERVLLRAAEEGVVDWERAMGWMPREMLELANSKACRNAIMFGDHLSLDQCGRLLAQLAKTRHPFICAHGRPSFVPVVSVALGVEDGRRRIDWKGWKMRIGD